MTGAAVTGLGVVSALGEGAATTLEALAAGVDGLRPIEHFDTSDAPFKLGGTVPGFEVRRPEAGLEFAERAAREALGAASGDQVGLIVGTSLGGAGGDLHQSTARLRARLGLRGPALTVSTACCSSTHAIGLGAEWILAGDCETVLVGGYDELTPTLLAGFGALGALSTEKCAPFSLPVGTTLGEGAAFLRLERSRPGAPCIATVLGVGLSSDARHATAPDPGGRGVARALGAALAQAGVRPEAVDYVNAHGTGTAQNDAAEWAGLTAVFGRSAGPFVSSCKGTFGHTQGAAGAVELVATLLCASRGTVPPTQQHRGPRNRCPPDPVAQARPRAATVRTWATTNSAFWGANAALVGSVGASDAISAEAPTPVSFLGAARATAAELDEWPDVSVDPMSLEPLARLLVVAAGRVLALHPGFGSRGARERCGLFVAADSASRDARTSFASSVAARSLSRCSTDAFTRLVASAAPGAAARALTLAGPFTTVTSGDGSGLVALICGARYLASHADVDAIVVAAVDEPTAGAPAAVAALLGRSGAAMRGRSLDRTALGAPGDLRAVIARTTTAGAGYQSVAPSGDYPMSTSLAHLMDLPAGHGVIATAGGTAAGAIHIGAEQP